MRVRWLTSLILSFSLLTSFALKLPFSPDFNSQAACNTWVRKNILAPIKHTWFEKLTSNQVQDSETEIKQLSHFSRWFKNAINNSEENYNQGLLTSIHGVCYLFSSTNPADHTLGKQILNQEISAFNSCSTSLPTKIPLRCDINKHCTINNSTAFLQDLSISSTLPFGSA
ncbi:hypothetical protein A0O36_01232 [Piscirickettsiaceae bacterium NZ-RLO1]|nr:hypothetical protein A0O36_01232 [Piscirickettsiaceae bacterium NZ-RLO1]